MDSYVGEIRMFAGKYAPEGWADCDGSLLQISNYEALYSLIGITYGGDGQKTFALPDLRGRLPVGQGQGAGLTTRTLGQQSLGAEAVVLTSNTIPAHTHNFNVTSAAATDTDLTGTTTLAQPASGTVCYINNSSTLTAETLAASSISNCIGGASHSNVMPSLVVRYIISLTGLYPTHS